MAPGTLRAERMSDVLSFPVGAASCAPRHQESRRVVRFVFDVAREQLELVEGGCGPACDRGRGPVFGRELRRFGVADDRHLLGMREMGRKPALALRKALGVRPTLPMAAVLFTVLMRHWRIGSITSPQTRASVASRRSSERPTAPSVSLDRHDRITDAAVFDTSENFVDRPARAERRRGTEMLERGFLTVCAFRSEKSHGDRVLQRTTRRHDLRKDALHSTIRERSRISCATPAQDLRLALRPVNRAPFFASATRCTMRARAESSFRSRESMSSIFSRRLRVFRSLIVIDGASRALRNGVGRRRADR